MNKYKMLDLLHASNEEAGEIVGAICPRINSIRLGYKQSCLERNVNRTFFHLSTRQEELETRLLQLESNEKTYQYLIKISEMLLDQIVDEIQEQKVDYIHLLLRKQLMILYWN